MTTNPSTPADPSDADHLHDQTMTGTVDAAQSPAERATAGDRRKAHRWWQAPRRIVLVYLVIFAASELLGAYVSITAQAAVDAVMAFVAVNHGVFGYRTQRTAGVVMSAIFTTRLMALTLPFTDVSLTTRTAMVGAATVLVCYLATYVLSQDISAGRKDEGFPLKRPFLSANVTLAITALSGIPIGWAAYKLLEPTSLMIQPLWESSSLPWIVAGGALVLGALGEELLYRRMVAAMVQHTAQSQTPWISGLLFAASYLGTRNIGFVALMFATGAFFAWSCERTGTIKGVVVAHAIASLLVFIVLPG